MKIEFVVLVACVVSTFALLENDDVKYSATEKNVDNEELQHRIPETTDDALFTRERDSLWTRQQEYEKRRFWLRRQQERTSGEAILSSGNHDSFAARRQEYERRRLWLRQQQPTTTVVKPDETTTERSSDVIEVEANTDKQDSKRNENRRRPFQLERRYDSESFPRLPFHPNYQNFMKLEHERLLQRERIPSTSSPNIPRINRFRFPMPYKHQPTTTTTATPTTVVPSVPLSASEETVIKGHLLQG